MRTRIFEVVLEKPPDMQTAYITVPFDVREVYGTGAQVKVSVTIDGVPYRTSITPMGGGVHTMVIPREIREQVGKSAGETVHIVMQPDTEPRVVEVPADFRRALGEHPAAKAVFDAFAYTHRKEYVRWIESAKKAETRESRIRKAVEQIAQGVKLS